ncbi:hypothetical protein DFR67_103439 [Williamsia limnetica]|uniref:Uncharacterized protein n=1 Tax=Williamsia limnetica TaxID=882452 RepID=A0A318RQX8_WILLI|nr:hypothetical protein DFR67_103439 [Williamsia limnetica]
MTIWADVLVRASAALAAIYLFYLAASTKWPSSYYLLDDAIGARVSKTTFSYLSFRFLPLFVASLCAMGYLSNVTERLAVALCIGVGHLVISVVRINPYTNPGPRREKSWYVLQAAVLLVSVCFLAIAVWLAPLFGTTLPQWRDFTTAIVTALIVVCVGVFIQSATSKDVAVNSNSIDLARRRYKPMVDRLALEHGVDRSFALALVIAEDLQRPRWFRVIERRLARARLARTVGVGQSTGQWFITDEQGIAMLLSSIGSLSSADGDVSRAKMAAAAEKCNEGDGYVEFVLRIHGLLEQGIYRTSLLDTDGNPLITASPLSLLRGEWVVSGDVGPSVHAITIVNNTTREIRSPALHSAPGLTRTSWSATLPVEWTSITVLPDPHVTGDYRSEVALWPPY